MMTLWTNKIDVARTSQQALDWLLPQSCLLCAQVLGSRNGVHVGLGQSQLRPRLCIDCFTALPFRSETCHQCGQLLDATHEYCARCIVQPPAYRQLFAPFSYQAPISQLLQRFKYNGDTELATDLACLMSIGAQELGLPKPERLLPIPLHWRRLSHRGYNQAALLAKALAKIWQCPVQFSDLRRSKATSPQVGMSTVQRRNNLRGTMCLKRPTAKGRITIIDDVVTTGATVGEATKTLRRHGFEDIDVWCLARTDY